MFKNVLFQLLKDKMLKERMFQNPMMNFGILNTKQKTDLYSTLNFTGTARIMKKKQKGWNF